MLEARRLRGTVDQRATHRAKVQIGAEPLCKGESGEAARGACGHGDMGTRGGNEDTRTRGHEGRRELAPGFWRLKAEQLIPERLMPWWPSPVTWNECN